MTLNFGWQKEYTEALLELNRKELPWRIEAAEKIIYQRLEELKNAGAASTEELWAINDALRGLRVLAKTECPPQYPSEDTAPRPAVAS